MSDPFSKYQAELLEKDDPLASFNRDAAYVEENVHLIQAGTQTYAQLLNKLQYTASDAEITAIMNEMAQKANEVNDVIATTNQQIKNIQNENERLPKNNINLRIRMNQTSKFTRSFLTALKEFQRVQKESRIMANERFERQYRIVNPNADEREIQEALEKNETSSLFSRAILDQTKGYQARQALQNSKSRFEAVSTLTNSIATLQELMLSIDALVSQQGTLLDSIESNIDSVERDVEQGEKQLSTATKFAAAARQKRKCLFITGVITVVVIAVVVVVVVLVNRGTTKTVTGT